LHAPYRGAFTRPRRPADQAARAATVLVVSTFGLGLNYWAWTLIGPLGLEPDTYFGLDPRQWALLGAVTAVAGSLAATPVGMAADHFRAPVVLALVTTAAAVSVLALATVGSAPVLVLVAVLAGIGGTALTAGTVVVARACPPSWRGMALSVFSAGMVLAAATATATRSFWAVDLHGGLLTLAASLLGYALLTALLTGVTPATGRPAGARLREALSIVRTPAVGHLVSWYSAATCAMVSFDLYLPTYLHSAFGTSLTHAAGYAAACFGISAVSRPFGGWWCRRRDAAPLLTVCFSTIGASLVAFGFVPDSPMLFGAACVGVAVGSGLIAGTVFAVLGRTAPVNHIGTITGLVSTGAGLLGVLPPLLLTGTGAAGRFHPVVMTVLACVALAAARRVHVRRAWIAAAAAFPSPVTVGSMNGTTVVAVSAAQVGPFLADVVSALAALARTQEVVIAYAVADHHRDGYALVSALRSQLPRHTVLGLPTADPPHHDEVDILAEMVETGALPIALLPGSRPDISAITLARDLRANQAVHLSVNRFGSLASADTPATQVARLPTVIAKGR